MTARRHSTSDFDFHLPADRIAQIAAEPRDAARLMVVDRSTGSIEHRVFRDIGWLVPDGDVLALNTTRVMRARLLGTRESGATAEVLLLRATDAGEWEAMVSPGTKLRPGKRVHVAPGFDVEIVAITDRGTRIVALHVAGDAGDAIERHGHVPLPPYIDRADTAEDAERYQTVYARERGSVAAPTAGLHFTPALLDALAARGVRRADLVLHVGAGTFKPVDVDDPAQHVMHEESFAISERAARTLNETRAAGGRVWAVGTTSVRALESAARDDGAVAASSGHTRIFIRPGYRFRAVD
ncbi:MAG: tRNA preQ1(34) S-adenosylmethionine ribosyltransferase-isomerase QueA, partial [Gemmatimonadaceae bacterium]